MYPVDLHMHTVASTHAYSTLSDLYRGSQTQRH
ncbi:Putative hydrolase YcdX [Salmonella enterica subsp. enterica]|uniref:Hydrolase YcdX n=1 Tax=Salmonella enterica I TaxID=59201 RepID=A0A3S4KCD3_SALET|nr:Putative hydrolase YcdX [Salmonella enterica subsp. enterica]